MFIGVIRVLQTNKIIIKKYIRTYNQTQNSEKIITL